MLRQDGPPPDRALAELLDRQWGVASLAQLRAIGLTARAVQQRAAAGRLRRLHRGVYSFGDRALRVEGRRLAAVLACGAGAVLSHRSAASHWGLLHTDQVGIDVTAPRSREAIPGIRLHSSRSLDAQDTTNHEGIPTTTVPRTLLDLAATVRSDRLERALAQAMYLRLYDQRAIDDAIARSTGHRGSGILARATAREPKRTRSEFEARFLKLVREAGLPEPEVNASLAALDHRHIEVDFYWPSYRLIVETDGWEAHGTRAAFESDRAKDAALTAAGYRVVRFTWSTPNATILRRLSALLQN